MFNRLAEMFFSKANSNSKTTAKNRLQMVLVQDRSGLSPQDMDFFKKDLLDVISKYFVLERKNVEIEWQRENNSTALLINTPVICKPRQVQKVA
ncbi:cell division topological specificity factor MinE [bacterium]|nr:cell division topological specificity factor MinE [bacterium]